MKPTTKELAEFVRQSNKIEMEPETPGHPLYDDHLRVAELIVLNPWFYFDPRTIHRWLMASQPEKFPGELRQVGVSVGGELKMHAIYVREEFEKLTHEVEAQIGQVADPEGWCWSMHHRLEWIHPFWDGNGRTGRLWMNALRQFLGLPWLTVSYEDRFSYYRSIVEWEREHEAMASG